MTNHEHDTTHNETEDIVNAIADIRKTVPYEYGHGAEGDDRDKIIHVLDGMGISGSEQSEETLELNIYNARSLVENGEAERILQEHPFVDEYALKRNKPHDQVESTLIIDFPEPINISWARLDGAASFDSWLGRGVNGTGEVASRGTGPNRTSIDAIVDYATRDTLLPPIDVQLYLTDDKIYLFAENSHTAAAAILRQENLKCKWLRVTDVRTRKDSSIDFR